MTKENKEMLRFRFTYGMFAGFALAFVLFFFFLFFFPGTFRGVTAKNPEYRSAAYPAPGGSYTYDHDYIAYYEPPTYYARPGIPDTSYYAQPNTYMPLKYGPYDGRDYEYKPGASPANRQGNNAPTPYDYPAI